MTPQGVRMMMRALLAAMLIAHIGYAAAREWRAVGATFPAVIESDNQGRLSGYGVDLLQAIARELGEPIRIEMLPWARAQHLVETGRADLLIGPYHSAERAKRFAYSAQPIFRDHLVFYARSVNPPAWSGDLAQLGNTRIGAVLGWHYGDAFEAARPHLRLRVVAEVEEGIASLTAGTMDLLASNRRDTVPRLRKLGATTSIVALSPSLGSADAWFAFPHDAEHAALRVRIDSILARLASNGEMARLASRHSIELPPYSNPSPTSKP